MKAFERRRSPRAVVLGDEAVRLEVSHRVRLLDISHSGVLLGADTAVPQGTHGDLQLALDGQPFSAKAVVMRQQARDPRWRARIGARFVSLGERSRVHLERFLGRAKQ